MNFNINDFIKSFGSIYKITLILFLTGVFLILSTEEIRKIMFLQDFINTYNIFIGLTTLISAIVLIIYFCEKIKQIHKSNKIKKEFFKDLKDLTIQEKRILLYFLKNKSQISDLGIKFSYQENEPIKELLAKRYIIKNSTQRTPYYVLNKYCWNVLQNKDKEIFYEEEFYN